MSAVDAPKPVEVPSVGTAEPVTAPVVATDNVTAPVEAPKTEEVPATEGETAAAAAVADLKEDKAEEKIIEPIHSGALGYKAPGLKNAFRFAKKYFWFGEEPVPSANLREYLRGEKPEVAHPVVAWSSQTGKGLLFFVKHADQKEHPAGVINLAYATDLVKDGALAFSVKISGHKHTFEAQNAAERDGWFVAVEKAITEAKASKDTIESSEGYKEHKDKISKPTALVAAAASSSSPKKSIDATPKLAETEATGSEAPVVAAPARTGSSSSSSSDEEKKAKKAKSKSRSVSRKRASIFGGLLGKKDKEPKDATTVAQTDSEIKKEEATTAPQLGETSTTAPVITSDIPHAGEELKTEATPALAAAPVEEPKTEDATAAPEKPVVKKRGSIFGNFVEKLKSPTHEKKEHELVAPQTPAKDAETIPEAPKALEEAQVGVPSTPVVAEPTSESVAPATEEVKPAGTPSKEKEHFSFGKLFGSKERSKSPAATDKVPEPKIDATAPKIEDSSAPATAPVVAEPAPLQTVEPIAPVTENKVESSEETPKKEKRASFFGNLSRSLSKATSGKKEVKKDEKKETAAIPEGNEEIKSEAPVLAAPVEETSTLAPTEKTIGDVPAEAVTVGEAPKGTQTIPTTA